MSIKQARIAGRIRTILSELLINEVSDPALQGITFTKVEIDSEMNYARVYVNALGEEDRRDEVMQGLNRAKGFLRREVGSSVRLRKTPELHFIWDESLAKGERINQILRSLDIPPAPPEEESIIDDEDWDDDDE